MSDIDLDEDLLALAGAGDEGSETETEVSHKRSKSASGDSQRKKSKLSGSESQPDASEDEEDDDNYDPADNDAGIQAVNGDNDDHENDDDDFKNPYPIDGKYKDEEDMEWLESLSEIKREEILFERSQKIQEINQRKYLAQRLRESRQQDEHSRKGTQSSKKKSQLSELKKRREEKHKTIERRRRERQDESDEDSDYGKDDKEDEDEEGSYEEDDKVQWVEPEKAKEASLSDINKVRFGRSLFAKFCHYPEFSSVVVDCFSRLNVGIDKATGQSSYRMVQIKAVIDSKPYKISNERIVDQRVVVAQGTTQRRSDMSVFSDQPITREEFDRYKNQLLRDKSSLPSVNKLQRKFGELTRMSRRQLTPEETNQVIQRRQKLSANMLGANAILQKSILQEELLEAKDNNDLDKVAELEARLDQLESKMQTQHQKVSTQESSLDKLAKVNERNRKINQEYIRKAEIKNQETRRKQDNTSGVTGNPFSRLRTNARIFYQDTNNKSEDIVPKEDATKTVEKRENGTVKARHGGIQSIDDLIASIELGFEIIV